MADPDQAGHDGAPGADDVTDSLPMSDTKMSDDLPMGDDTNAPTDGEPTGDTEAVGDPQPGDTMIAGDATAAGDPAPDGDTLPMPCTMNDTAAALGAAQLQALRAVATSTATVNLNVGNAYVSYVQPTLVNGSAAFFLQATPTGPAIMVAIDPATLTPVPRVGDVVGMTATTVTRLSGMRQVTALSSLVIKCSGADLAPLVQDLTAASDLVTNIDSYESELVAIDAAVAGPYHADGAGFLAAAITSTGIPAAAPNLVLRAPESLLYQRDVTPGCRIHLGPSPLLRSGTNTVTVQAHAFQDAEITDVVGCAAPAVTSAAALSPTELVVSFDRELLANSVNASTQFPIIFDTGELAVTGLPLAVGHQVFLATQNQTAGVSYTVSVDGTVTDLAGLGVGDTGTNAAFDFLGASGGCGPSQLVISQIYGGGGRTGAAFQSDFVELHNRGPSSIDLNGLSLQRVSDTGSTWSVTPLATSSLIVPAGSYFLVKGRSDSSCGGNPCGEALPTPDLDLSGSANWNFAADAGRLAVVQGTTALAACNVTTAVREFVGYGVSAACAAGLPTVTGANTLALMRRDQGCTNTGSNRDDFAVATPAPRSSMTPAHLCGCD